MPLLAAIGAFVLLLAAELARILYKTGGHFTYAFDDAYIHLAIARHLVSDGVWGVTPFAFSPASSSIAWPIVLAGTAASVWAPFVLNVLAGGLLLVAADRVLVRHQVPAGTRTLCLCLIATASGLPVSVLAGMEHVVQCLLAVLLATAAAGDLAVPGRSRGTARLVVPLLAAALVAVRYDGIFVVAPIVCGYLVTRRWRAAFATGIAALVAPAVFMLASLWAGGSPVPNPVLLKSAVNDFPRTTFLWSIYFLGYAALQALVWRNPALLSMVVLSTWHLAVRLRRARGAFDERSILLALVVASALVHAEHGDGGAGALFRYDTYLIVLGLLANAAALRGEAQLFPRRLGAEAVVVGLLVVLFATPLLHRPTAAARTAESAAIEQFGKLHSLGLFLQRFRTGEIVALNDIGEPCFLADIHLIDTDGVGSPHMLPHMLAHQRGPDVEAKEMVKAGVTLAIADYAKPEWPGWTHVACWSTDFSGSGCTADDTNFYVRSPADGERLRRELETFILPAGVRLARDTL